MKYYDVNGIAKIFKVSPTTARLMVRNCDVGRVEKDGKFVVTEEFIQHIILNGVSTKQNDDIAINKPKTKFWSRLFRRCDNV